MIRPGAVVMTVLMSAVAVGVYFGLDYLPQGLVPGLNPQKNQTAATSADEKVIADSAGATTAAEAMAPDAMNNQSAVVTEEDLAEEPPAAEPIPLAASAAPSAASTVDYDPPADGAGVPVEEETASAAPSAAPAPAAPAEPKPEPEPATEPPAKKPAKVARASQESDSAPRPVTRKAPDADLIKPWWPDPATIPANQLKLQYAGQVQNEQAIALLFSAPLNLDSLKQNAEVRDSTGDPMPDAQWELAKNQRMAVLRGVKPGRYTVILGATVADANGYLLGAALQGPVYIQAP